MSGRTISGFRGSVRCRYYVLSYDNSKKQVLHQGIVFEKVNPYIRIMDMSLHQSHSDMCDIVRQHVTMCQASLMVNHSNNSMLYMNFPAIQVHLRSEDRLQPAGVLWIITN